MGFFGGRGGVLSLGVSQFWGAPPYLLHQVDEEVADVTRVGQLPPHVHQRPRKGLGGDTQVSGGGTQGFGGPPQSSHPERHPPPPLLASRAPSSTHGPPALGCPPPRGPRCRGAPRGLGDTPPPISPPPPKDPGIQGGTQTFGGTTPNPGDPGVRGGRDDNQIFGGTHTPRHWVGNPPTQRTQACRRAPPPPKGPQHLGGGTPTPPGHPDFGGVGGVTLKFASISL